MHYRTKSLVVKNNSLGCSNSTLRNKKLHKNISSSKKKSMTEVLQSPSHFPSSPSSPSPCAPPTTASTVFEYDGSYPNALLSCPTLNDHLSLDLEVEGFEQEQEQQQQEEVGSVGDRKRKERDRAGDQISILALLIAAFRKSLIGCSTDTASGMEIGWPSEVRHVAHVTFDRFHGFLGLPVEFEPEVPRRPPSASASVFGVSTESMQLSFDARGNSVPTILLLMQRQLYAQGGLQAEGIFRINGENGQEEHVREHLNRGIVLEGIDVHCLAGLIKAWFRELPTGVLDSLSPEQVMQSQSEEECAQLARLLPPTEAALLDWAINLMADVAQMEHLNKMDARNIAMVFAPNMTQMSDPLTALMYAVQVMNFLKTLVVKTLKERAESMVQTSPPPRLEPFEDDEHQSSSQLVVKENNSDAGRENETDTVVGVEEPSSQRPPLTFKNECEKEGGNQKFLTSVENVTAGGSWSLVDGCPCGVVSQFCSLTNGLREGDNHAAATKPEQINISRSKSGHSGNSNLKKVNEPGQAEKNRGTAIISRINSRTELVEAWR